MHRRSGPSAWARAKQANVSASSHRPHDAALDRKTQALPEGPAIDAGYIQSWLSQIHPVSCLDPSSLGYADRVESPSGPGRLPHIGMPMAAHRQSSRREPVRRSSPSLFVRDSPLPSPSRRRHGDKNPSFAIHAPSSPHSGRGREWEQQSPDFDYPRHQSESSSTDFRRRPRRKTRQDRYETRGEKLARQAAMVSTPTRPSRRRRHRKSSWRAGREIMKHFASDAVSSNRVTVSLHSSHSGQARSELASGETKSDGRPLQEWTELEVGTRYVGAPPQLRC